ncbi:MAG: hypothetical protein AAGN35_01280 [Bacteroidota bacterium]
MKMLHPILGCILGASLLLLGCGSPHLERPGIPLAWGMRMESPADEAEINANLAKMRDLVTRQIVLELPVEADSAGLPRIKALPLGSFVTLARQYKIRFNLALTTLRPQDLFPRGEIADPNAWFDRYTDEVDSLLQVLAGYPPERVILGNDWRPAEAHPNHFRTLLKDLRTDYRNRFAYGARVDRLEEIPFWAACQEIAIDYTPTAAGDLKATSRKINPRAGEFAAGQRLPIFIFRANIIGPEPALQLKNRLRFWPERTPMSGICINTIYPTIAARDSVTYYGLAQEPEFFEFMEEYRLRTP